MKALMFLCLASLGTPAAALPADPLGSPFWTVVAGLVLGDDARVRFDDRVKVNFPAIAENQRVFPVTVDARGIAGVRRIVIFADLNPLQKAVDFAPQAAEPFIGVRIKLDQRTPVRGAVQLANGEWLVSGGWIDAAGGGCSLPPVSHASADWAQHLGEARGGLWTGADGTRAMLSFRHPMDTGFVDNIPSYWLETVTLAGADGRGIGRIEMQASVAEDPVLVVMPRLAPGEALAFGGRDTNGIEYRGRIAASPLPGAAGR